MSEYDEQDEQQQQGHQPNIGSNISDAAHGLRDDMRSRSGADDAASKGDTGNGPSGNGPKSDGKNFNNPDNKKPPKKPGEAGKKGADSAKNAGEQAAKKGAEEGAKKAAKTAAKAGGRAIQAATGIPVNEIVEAAKKLAELNPAKKIMKQAAEDEAAQKAREAASEAAKNEQAKAEKKTEKKRNGDDYTDGTKKGKLVGPLAVIAILCVLTTTIAMGQMIFNPLTVAGLFTLQFNSREDAQWSLAKQYEGTMWAETANKVDNYVREHPKNIISVYIRSQEKLVGFYKGILGFFGGDSKFFDDDPDVTDDFQMGEYYPADEYNDTLLENIDLCNQTLKRAYKTAKKEAKQYCEENNYQWKYSKPTLKDTESDSWEKVYKEINYADLISGLSLGCYGSSLDDFSSEDFEKYLKDDDHLQYLYFNEYTPVESDEPSAEEMAAYNSAMASYQQSAARGGEGSEPQLSSFVEHKRYVIIKIHPYVKYDLFAMFQRDINEEALYSRHVTFFDMLDMQRKYMEAEANDEVRAKLGLEYETPLTRDEVREIKEIDVDPENVPQQDLDPNGENYEEIEAAEIADDYDFLYQGWCAMYSKPTVSGGGYFVNTVATTKSLVSGLNNAGLAVRDTSSEWCSYEFGSWQGSLHGVAWQAGPGNSAMCNGRYLIAVGPGIVHRDYWNTTGGVGNPAEWYSYGNKKMDLVLTERATGKKYYVPVTTGDSKAHTFPTGIIQTGVRLGSSMTSPLNGAIFSGSDDHFVNVGTPQNYAATLMNYDNLLYGATGRYHIDQWMSHGACEWCYKCPGMDISQFKKEYQLEGIMVY